MHVNRRGIPVFAWTLVSLEGMQKKKKRNLKENLAKKFKYQTPNLFLRFGLCK